jgi:hypothetical protein
MGANASDDPIRDWVHQPIPEKLWHYTSTQGFQGIIASAGIYATDVRFLNDAEEFVHIRKVADDLLAKTPEVGEFNLPLREYLKWLVNQIFKSDFLDPNSAQIFVASFTDSADDLSQWRAYSHGTCGASVSFDLRWIRPPLESDSAVTFAPCLYQDEEKQQLIQHAFNQFIDVTQSRWTNAHNEFVSDYISKGKAPDQEQIASFVKAKFDSPDYTAQLLAGLVEAKKRIVRLAGLLKHRAFHHEREWRLVLPISPGKDKSNLTHPIRFRSTSASLIPYIEVPLVPSTVPQTPGSQPAPLSLLPVNDVLLGPGADSTAQSAASEFLRSKSIKVVPKISDVPYRQV